MSEIEALPEKRNSATGFVSEANAASFKLIELAVFVGAETIEIVQSGVTSGGEPVGGWKISTEEKKISTEEKKISTEESDAEQLEMFSGVPGVAPAGPGHGDS